MKRRALDTLPSAASKKQWMGLSDPSSRESPLQDINSNFDLSEDESQEGEHYISVDGASTPPTTLSTASRKFPSDLKTIPCTHPGCSKTFNRPARLTAHLRSHAGERPFRCTQCDKSYMEEKHLRQHVKGSHTQERTYPCQHPGCGKSFLTGSRLRRHAAVHEGAERFRCRGYDGCDKSFRKHSTLQRHIRAEHLHQKAFPCTKNGCLSGFDSSGALRRHVEREHGDIRFWCDECGDDGDVDGGEPEQTPVSRVVGFTTLALLEAHIRLEHILCIFCEVKCRSPTELDRHLETAHTTKPPVVQTTVEERKTIACTWDGCSKKFTRRGNLGMHIRTAHEGFRFECGLVDLTASEGLGAWDGGDACGKAFHSKMRLEDHVRVFHLRLDRPAPTVRTAAPVPETTRLVDILSGAQQQRIAVVTCTFEGCTATFQRYADLDRHVRVHSLPLGSDADAAAPVHAPALENEALNLLAEYNARSENELTGCSGYLPHETREWPCVPEVGATQMGYLGSQPGPSHPDDIPPYLDPTLFL